MYYTMRESKRDFLERSYAEYDRADEDVKELLPAIAFHKERLAWLAEFECDDDESPTAVEVEATKEYHRAALARVEQAHDWAVEELIHYAGAMHHAERVNEIW